MTLAFVVMFLSEAASNYIKTIVQSCVYYMTSLSGPAPKCHDNNVTMILHFCVLTTSNSFILLTSH